MVTFFFLLTDGQSENVTIQVDVKKQNFRDFCKLKLGLNIFRFKLFRPSLLHRKNLGWFITD